MRVTVTMQGDLLRDLQNMGAAAKPRAKRAIQIGMDRIVARAREIAPDDEEGATPDLRLSIRSTVANRKGGVRGSVIAGGDALTDKLRSEHRKNPASHTLYAIEQHEDPTFKHKRGQSNFVGAPFMALAPLIGSEIDKEITNARA